MRSLWNGSISFGLVNIPVKMFAATESRSIKFNYLHRACHNPIQYRKYCPYCNSEVGQDDLVKGYEYEKGSYVVLEEDELEGLPAVAGRTIEIINFISSGAIDPIYYDKTYYLSPSEMGIKAYRLLLEALRQTGSVGIAKMTIRNKQHLAVLRIYQDVLTVETMFYPEEVRSPAALPAVGQEGALSQREIDMALQLVKSLTADFEPEQYQDEYRRELLELIKAKVNGQEVVLPAPRREEKVVDLVEALKASVEAAKKQKEPGRRAKARVGI